MSRISPAEYQRRLRLIDQAKRAKRPRKLTKRQVAKMLREADQLIRSTGSRRPENLVRAQWGHRKRVGLGNKFQTGYFDKRGLELFGRGTLFGQPSHRVITPKHLADYLKRHKKLARPLGVKKILTKGQRLSGAKQFITTRAYRPTRIGYSLYHKFKQPIPRKIIAPETALLHEADKITKLPKAKWIVYSALNFLRIFNAVKFVSAVDDALTPLFVGRQASNLFGDDDDAQQQKPHSAIVSPLRTVDFDIRSKEFIDVIDKYVAATGKDFVDEVNQRLYSTALNAGADRRRKARLRRSLRPSQTIIKARGMRYFQQTIQKNGQRYQRATAIMAGRNMRNPDRRKKKVPHTPQEVAAVARRLVRRTMKTRFQWYRNGLIDVTSALYNYAPRANKGEFKPQRFRGAGKANPAQAGVGSKIAGGFTLMGGKIWNWADRTVDTAVTEAMLAEQKHMMKSIHKRLKKRWTKSR